ncbi:MAG: hypothetical protein V7721_01940 [Porticoccaceae bacterium]
MHFIIIGVSIGLLIASIISLIGGYFLIFFLQLGPAIILFTAKRFPNNFVAQSLATTINPVPREGMLKSRLSAECALFYAKIAIILVSIFLVVNNSGVAIDMNDTGNPIVLMLYLIPLSALYVTFMSLFYSLRFLYINI